MANTMLPSELINRGWCQEAFALDDEGFDAVPSSSKACKWCLSGAISACKTNFGLRLDLEYQNLVSQKCRGLTLIEWNDQSYRTKQDVLDLCFKVEKELDLQG